MLGTVEIVKNIGTGADKPTIRNSFAPPNENAIRRCRAAVDEFYRFVVLCLDGNRGVPALICRGYGA